MGKSQRLETEQRLGQRLTQQQLRFVKLLELSAPELEDAVSRELDENPALERVEEPAKDEPTSEGEAFRESAEELQRADYANEDDIPVWRLPRRERRRDDAYEFIPPDDEVSFYEDLSRQIDLKELDETVAAAAKYIAGNLDSNGYLRRPLQGILDDLLFNEGVEVSEEQGRQALEVVKSLEPPGIGAQDLRETLLLQLRRMAPSPVRDKALEIIGDEFDAFTKKHLHLLQARLHLTAAEASEAVDLIRTLNPKPGSALGSGASTKARPVIPDIFIDNEDGEITVTLNNSIPELRIEASFEQAMRHLEKTADKRARKGNEFITGRYNDARSFIKLIKNRQDAMLSVMAAIVKIQERYLLTEDIRDLQPMTLMDISQLTGMDITVISRATNNKYASTPWGVFPLRHFFSDSVGTSTGDVSNKRIKEELRRLIDAEDKRHPMSDEKLTGLLVAKGLDVNRRTVSKYRAAMQIPVARLRKEM